MKKRVAIVTGVSRLRGIGRSICLALAAQGHDICFSYFQAYDNDMPWGAEPNSIEIISQEIRDIGARCCHLEMDLRKTDAAMHILDLAEKKLGPASTLINNATYSTASSIKSINGPMLDQHYEVNVRANVLLTQAFIKRIAANQAGRIINISSGQSLGPMPEELAYAMTKNAIDHMTQALATTLAASGITINSVNPGPTDTGWMTAELADQLKEASPNGRIGQPEDAAKIVAFLASEEAAWITGQIIHSEGGFDRYKRWG